MIILDTDILTIYQQADREEFFRLMTRLEKVPQKSIWTTIVSFEEQIRGWLALVAQARSLDKLIFAYSRLHSSLNYFKDRLVVDFDQPAASIYQDLLKSRIRIGTMDLRIAAIAKANQATLLTRNLADFRKVPSLRVEDWSLP